MRGTSGGLGGRGLEESDVRGCGLRGTRGAGTGVVMGASVVAVVGGVKPDGMPRGGRGNSEGWIRGLVSGSLKMRKMVSVSVDRFDRMRWMVDLLEAPSGGCSCCGLRRLRRYHDQSSKMAINAIANPKPETRLAMSTTLGCREFCEMKLAGAVAECADVDCTGV